MKRFHLLAGAAAIVLSACASSGTASLLSVSAQNQSGFTGIQTMRTCVMESGNCFPLEVESDGSRIVRIHYPTDIWVTTTESGCSNGYCWATDANGAEWKMEP